MKTKMKKNRHFFLLAIFFIFFFSSCTVFKNSVIEKRQYRPGFFVRNSTIQHPFGFKKSFPHFKQNEKETIVIVEQSPVVAKPIRLAKHNEGEPTHLIAQKIKTIGTVVKKKFVSANANKHVDTHPFVKTANALTKNKNQFVASHLATKHRADGGSSKGAGFVFFLLGLLLLLGLKVLFQTWFPIMSASIALGLAFIISIPILILLVWLWFSMITNPDGE
jgi:hypothetical protein